MFHKAIVLVILTLVFSSTVFTQTKSNDQFLWDDQPATDWMTQAYPIGNGRLGAMIFGGVSQEHIQFNENSLWTGDEKETGSYQNFGDIFIDFDSTGDFENYARTLDFEKSIHTTNYTIASNQFSRTYFASQPDQVLVFYYSSKQKGKLSGKIRLIDAH